MMSVGMRAPGGSHLSSPVPALGSWDKDNPSFVGLSLFNIQTHLERAWVKVLSGTRVGAAWATPASIIVASLIVSSSLCSSPSSPPPLRVRREAGERTSFTPASFPSFPSRSEQRRPSGFVVKKRRRQSGSSSARNMEGEVVEEERERHGGYPTVPLFVNHQTAWCGLSDCHYTSLDSALFAFNGLLAEGIKRLADRMERSQNAAESVGGRLAEEAKIVGLQLEKMTSQLSEVKATIITEGADSRRAWQGLGDSLVEGVEGIRNQLKEDGEMGRSGTEVQGARIGRSVGEVKSQLATTGEESKGQSAQLTAQIVTGLTDISHQLRVSGEVQEGRLEELGTVLTTHLQQIRSQLEKEGGETSLVVREVKAELGARLQQLTRQVEVTGSEGRKQAEVATGQLVSTGHQIINGLYNITYEERNQLNGIREAMERASETATAQLEDQTKTQEAALAQVTSVLQRTGEALTDEASSIVNQMNESSDAETHAIGGITDELHTIVTQLERHNDERKREAQTNVDNLEKVTDVVKDSLENGAGRVAMELQWLSSNITRGFYSVKDDIEAIPKEIENISENIKENFGDPLNAIDSTIKRSFQETNNHIKELPNIKFGVIENALETINKDFKSTLAFEGEKLRNSIKEHSQVLVLRKRSLQHEKDQQKAGVLESYFQQILEQNKASVTDTKLQQQMDQIRDLRARLNENNNFNKVVNRVDDLSAGLDGFQNVLTRNAQISQLGGQINGINTGVKHLAHETLGNRDLSTYLLIKQQSNAAEEDKFREELRASENRFASQQHENQEWQRSLQSQISNRQAFEGLGSKVAGVSGNLNHLRGAFSTDTNINTLIAALKIENDAKTSSDQITDSHIRNQLSHQQSALNNLRVSGDVSKVSENLHNVEQTIAAGSQARTQGQSQENLRQLTQQGIGHNRESIEKVQDRENDNRNTEQVSTEVKDTQTSVERFRTSNSQAITDLKDQTTNAKGREQNQEETQNLVKESNQAGQTSFYYGSPENTQKKTSEQYSQLPEADAPKTKRQKRSIWQHEKSSGIRSAFNSLDESILRVAHSFFFFTNEANNRMHEALEDFEEKVIGAFKYGQVCYPGGGLGRRRRQAPDWQDTLASAAETNNTELFTLVFVKELEDNSDEVTFWADSNLAEDTRNFKYPFMNKEFHKTLTMLVEKKKDEKEDSEWDVLLDKATVENGGIPKISGIPKAIDAMIKQYHDNEDFMKWVQEISADPRKLTLALTFKDRFLISQTIGDISRKKIEQFKKDVIDKELEDIIKKFKEDELEKDESETDQNEEDGSGEQDMENDEKQYDPNDEGSGKENKRKHDNKDHIPLSAINRMNFNFLRVANKYFEFSDTWNKFFEKQWRERGLKISKGVKAYHKSLCRRIKLFEAEYNAMQVVGPAVLVKVPVTAAQQAAG